MTDFDKKCKDQYRTKKESTRSPSPDKKSEQFSVHSQGSGKGWQPMCFSPGKNKPNARPADEPESEDPGLYNDIETGRLMTSDYYTSMLRGNSSQIGSYNKGRNLTGSDIPDFSKEP